MRRLVAFLTLLPVLAACAGVGSITFNRQGYSWMTAFIDTGVPYCNGPNVPLEVQLDARVVRARALIEGVLRPGYGFKYGSRVDTVADAVERAAVSIANTSDPYVAERRFNEAQLEALDLAIEVIDNEHNTLFGIPNPLSAFNEAREKGIPMAIAMTRVSGDVAEFCADAGYSLADKDNIKAPPKEFTESDS